jgi:soluble lytic murein transglycosylase-like protein
MYPLKMNKIKKCVVFSGCLFLASNSYGITLVLKPVEQQSGNLASAPFPPRVGFSGVTHSSWRTSSKSHKKITIEKLFASNTQSERTLTQSLTKPTKEPKQSSQVNRQTTFAALSVPSPMGVMLGQSLALSAPTTKQSLIENRKQFFAASSAPNSIWSSMIQNFSLNHNLDRPEVNAQIALLRRNKKDLYQVLKAATPYISYVYEQTQKRGLPAELALLPVIESSFNPNSRSGPGATGIWQIMPGTAYDLGLKSNHAYDGRRDIVASTNAALKYLSYLHQTLGHNWQLALAAYNCGPGRLQGAVGRTFRSNGQSGFWNLHQLPRETKAYVPKLLALAAVIQNSARYQIQLPSITDGPHVASVNVPAHVSLREVAQSTGVSVATMRHLNPGYSKMATVPGAPNTLLIPVEKVALLQSNRPKFVL